MLRLYFSNRYDSLTALLFANLASPSGDPFAPESIIVPGTAIKRRLEMDYADRFGVCANVAFGYLAQWIWQQVGRVIEVSRISPFDAERLSWLIFRVLGDAPWIAPHPRLAAYLANADPVMRYALAQRLARLMEQYITYRPDWLAAWLDNRRAPGPADRPETHPDELWQAALWRQLAGELDIAREHPFVGFLRTLESAGAGGPTQETTLQSASLFCLPTIPPLYVDMLVRIAEWVDLHLYVLSPCAEYWHELVDPKRRARLEAAGRLDYQEVGHRLLAAWGRQAQSFVALLHDRTEGRGLECEQYVPSGRATLLGALQDEILTLEHAAGLAVSETDRSIEVHICHSLTRELEVLHDQLLDLLSGPAAVSPGEILVVMPALDEAAPLIHAVFGTAPEERHIPYVITGLPRTLVNSAAAALLALIELLPSRFKVSEVFDLLRRPLVHGRFGLDEDALQRVREWLQQSGIRWGLDGAHRAALGLPDSDHYSLQDGLDRLFLGYAVPQLSGALCGRLPAGDAEGADALALGAFDHFVRALEAARRLSLDEANGDVWRERLNGWVDSFLRVDGASIHEVSEVRGAIAALCDDLAAGAPRQALGLDVVAAALGERLADPARGALPSGSVTFAGMTPLRGLPYRAICVLGLNDGAFPAVDRPDEFDLIAAAPRGGDRQRRCDDRNVFLDLVLAARDRLYLSYTGFSIRDNSALTPSILLAELLDHVGAMLAGDGGDEQSLEAARRRLTVRHPLQAFSREYFSALERSDCRLFSYVGEYARALSRSSIAPVPLAAAPDALSDAPEADGEEDAVGERGAPFFTRPLPWPQEQPCELTLEDLKQFLRNPCRFLLGRRLVLSLHEAEEELVDDEPFLPVFDQRSVLAERLLPVIRGGAGAATITASAQAGTEYPSGALGEVLLAEELGLIAAFGEAIEAMTQAPLLPPVAERLVFQIGPENWTLGGTLNDLRSIGLVRWRYDDTRPVDYLSGWIDHLFLNAIAPAQVRHETVWLSRNGRYRLRACDQARAHLGILVTYYRRGLSEPLRFFPKSAWAYFAKLREAPSGALAAARAKWFGNAHTGHGERHGAAYHQALRGVADPLDGTFEAAAVAILAPLWEALDDERLP